MYEVTITIDDGQATMLLAALHAVSHLARVDGNDTPATTEVLHLFNEIGEKIFGGIGERNHFAAVEDLAELIEVGVLDIVHREFKRTKNGFERRT